MNQPLVILLVVFVTTFMDQRLVEVDDAIGRFPPGYELELEQVDEGLEFSWSECVSRVSVCAFSVTRRVLRQKKEY